MRNIEDVGADEIDDPITAFTSSIAFSEHFDELIHALERLTALPQTTIAACERAVETVSADSLTSGRHEASSEEA